MPKQHPAGMTYQNRRGANETLFNSPTDWISPNRKGGYGDDPPDTARRKVVPSDTDDLWGIGGDAVWVWKTVTRGLNPIFMNPYDDRVLAKETPALEAPRRAMGQVLEYSRCMNLARRRQYRSGVKPRTIPPLALKSERHVVRQDPRRQDSQQKNGNSESVTSHGFFRGSSDLINPFAIFACISLSSRQR